MTGAETAGAGEGSASHSAAEECERLRLQGNEALKAGKAARAVKLYSLALASADELPEEKPRKKEPTRKAALLANRCQVRTA